MEIVSNSSYSGAQSPGFFEFKLPSDGSYNLIQPNNDYTTLFTNIFASGHKRYTRIIDPNFTTLKNQSKNIPKKLEILYGFDNKRNEYLVAVKYIDLTTNAIDATTSANSVSFNFGFICKSPDEFVKVRKYLFKSIKDGTIDKVLPNLLSINRDKPGGFVANPENIFNLKQQILNTPIDGKDRKILIKLPFVTSDIINKFRTPVNTKSEMNELKLEYKKQNPFITTKSNYSFGARSKYWAGLGAATAIGASIYGYNRWRNNADEAEAKRIRNESDTKIRDNLLAKIMDPNTTPEQKKVLLDPAFFTDEEISELSKSVAVNEPSKLNKFYNYISTHPTATITGGVLTAVGLAGIYYLWKKWRNNGKIEVEDVKIANEIDEQNLNGKEV